MKRQLLNILLLCVLFVTTTKAVAAVAAQDENATTRKKVAVVLSGGGAKGVAHIGALRVIEEAGIPIDIVVGTSMGAIVGGLYSIGYTPDQLDSMVLSQDWGLLLSDRTPRSRAPFSRKETGDRYQVSYSFGRRLEVVGGVIRGTNLDMLFSNLTAGYHDSLNFSSLPIPFACVAADVVDGSTVVMRSGVLPTAMRASMAIPGVFTPVFTDGMVLVDGGIVNNFPTDVARSMGADVIIGVDVLSTLRSKDQLIGAPAVLAQMVDLSMRNDAYRENVARTDVYVKVDVEGYSSASFNLPALDTLIRRGESSMADHWEDLMSLKRGIDLTPDFAPPRHGPFVPLAGRGDFKIYDVSFESLTPREQRWLMRKCHIEPGGTISVTHLHHCVSMIGSVGSRTGVYYSLRDTLDGYNLTFHMNDVKENSLNAGVSFDTEEIAAVIVNGTLRFGKQTPQTVSLTGRFGKRSMGQLEYSLLTSPLSSFKLGYTFNRNNVVINSQGRRSYNPIYNHHLVTLSYLNMNFLRQNFRMEMGLAWEKYFYLSWLTDFKDFPHEGGKIPVQNDRLVSYFARLDYETLNSRYFATRGTSVSAAYELYTDNFVQYRDDYPFGALTASWLTAIPISGRFSLIPTVYGRVLFGDNVPFALLNMVGGKWFGRYARGQLPFDGVGYMQSVSNTFLAARLQARQRLGQRHYVSASMNYGLAAGDILGALPGQIISIDPGVSTTKSYFGASLDYGLDLRNFPVMVSLGWSNVSRRVEFYLQAGYTF